MERRLRSEDLPVRGVRWSGPLDPRAAWSVGRARIDGRTPALIHCHDAHALQVALLPALLKSVPLVASRRVHYDTSALKWNRAKRVVAISEVVASALREAGVDPERIRLVHSGVDPEELRTLAGLDPPVRERLGLGPDAFLVGNIGHLFPYKGQEVIPRAAALAPDDVHWVIVGEGSERERIEALATEHGVRDRMHLTGAIDDARRVLLELDLFVFPSVDEALGTSLLDAMTLGLPAVAADALGPAEILGPVRDEVGQGLFPVGDAEGLARAVERLRSDPDLRRRLAEAERKRAGEFSAEAMVEGTLGVYRELMA